MEISENDIIKECQKGNLGRFTFLYDAYFKKIYDFIYYRTMHQETAEDLTSQTFLKALENIKKYEAKKGSFSSWLYRIARNTVIDYYRTHKKEENIEDFWGLGEKDSIIEKLDIDQQLQKVKVYLQKFKPAQREIVMMRLWDNLSYQEISQITGLSLGSCKMTFSRVMLKFREETAFFLFFILLLTKII